MSLPHYFNNTDLIKVNWLTLGSNKFASDDHENKFLENLKKQPADWHYRTKEITYNVNSMGYRTHEFSKIDWKNSIVVFGCSMVAGIGVAEDETITYFLEKLLCRPVINLGVPGSGLDFNLYNNYLLKKNYPAPAAVINIFSNINRLANFKEEFVEFKGLWSEKDDYWKGFARNIHNPIIKSLMNSEITNDMWKNTCPSIVASWFDDTVEHCNVEKLYFTNTARDRMHCGADSNEQNASVLFEKLKDII